MADSHGVSLRTGLPRRIRTVPVTSLTRLQRMPDDARVITRFEDQGMDYPPPRDPAGRETGPVLISQYPHIGVRQGYPFDFREDGSRYPLCALHLGQHEEDGVGHLWICIDHDEETGAAVWFDLGRLDDHRERDFAPELVALLRAVRDLRSETERLVKLQEAATEAAQNTAAYAKEQAEDMASRVDDHLRAFWQAFSEASDDLGRRTEIARQAAEADRKHRDALAAERAAAAERQRVQAEASAAAQADAARQEAERRASWERPDPAPPETPPPEPEAPAVTAAPPPRRPWWARIFARKSA